MVTAEDPGIILRYFDSGVVVVVVGGGGGVGDKQSKANVVLSSRLFWPLHSLNSFPRVFTVHTCSKTLIS